MYNNITYKLDNNFNLLSDKNINLLNLLSKNLNIKISIIEIDNYCYDLIIDFKSVILKDNIKSKYRFSLFDINNKLRSIDFINFIIKNLLFNIDIHILDKKKFGIIPIKELPYNFFIKKLNNS